MRRSATVLLSSVLLSALHFGAGSAANRAPAPAGPTVAPGVSRIQVPDGGSEAAPPPRAGRFQRTATVGETLWVFIDSLETHSSPNNEGGWTHFDASEKPTAWHIDTFLGCQNHAWWCGVIDSSWTFDPNRAGYDNDWTQHLTNTFPTSGITPGQTVTLSFRHQLNAEPAYDFGRVEVDDVDDSWQTIATWSGEVPTGAGCDSFTVTVPDSIVAKWRTGTPDDPGPHPVPFRFTFTSDIAYSSADGLYTGDGWNVDNITVKAGQNVVFFDDVESGPGNWTVSTFPGVGDYFFLQSNVLSEDVCLSNQSKVWVDWNPIFQTLVPNLDNVVVTPPVAVSDASTVFVAFDVYRNLPLNSCFYYHVVFRTKNVGDPQWSGWIDPTFFVYYGGSKDWITQRIALPAAGSKDSVQVGLGLRDYANIFCGGVSSPSNTYGHFDNVAIGVIGQAGPAFVVRDIDLFNDTFQTTPFFNDDNFNSPIGDSTVVQVNASRGFKQGFLHYRINGGSFGTVPLQKSNPALPTHYYSDVPAASYPANTLLEYYYSATDSTDATAYFPSDAITNQRYRSAAILPLKTAINLPLGCTDSLASILFVNRFVGREPQPYIASALTALGYKYDTWDVNGPSSGIGNCIGGSDPATPQYHWPVTDVDKLTQYSTIIWHSGDLSAFTVTPQDQAVLQSWIQQPGKNRNFWITGDDVGYELISLGKNYNNFLGFTLGANWVRNIWENPPQDTLHPVVKGVNGSPSAGRFMHLNGGCPIINAFDMVSVSSTANSNGKAGLFLTYPNSFGAATRYATDYNTFNPQDSARVVMCGFSFNSIEEGGERLQLARAIVQTYFKENACYVASAVEEGTGTETPALRNNLSQNRPNPFNPETAIRYTVAQGGRVEIRIYNVNGALVRTLVDRPHGPGEYVARWNGTDDDGRPLPSGAYFYRLVSNGFEDSKKLLLLR